MEPALRPLWTASEDEISRGELADASAVLGASAIRAKGLNPLVRAEVRVARLPRAWQWSLLVGADEVASLLASVNLRVTAMPEGAVFRAGDPVVVIEGRYLDLAPFESAITGLLSHSSGIATVVSRARRAAGGRPVYTFGACNLHPALLPMAGKAAFIGGCEGVSDHRTSELIGERVTATIPAAYQMCVGDDRAAASIFDESVPADIPRVIPVGTTGDALSGALAAAEVLSDRLASLLLCAPDGYAPHSLELIRSLRWELGLRGYGHVGIILSGDFSEDDIPALSDGVDAFDVTMLIPHAPMLDFTVEVVEVDGMPRARQGVPSGAKDLWGCAVCTHTVVSPRGGRPPEHCSIPMIDMLSSLVELGTVRPRRSAVRIREDVIATLAGMNGAQV